MFYSLRGILTVIEKNSLIIECRGLEYRCITDNYTIYVAQSKINDEIKLYTKMIVKEDSLELFGFIEYNRLKCFNLLISVSGVGSRVALSLLSEFSPQQIMSFILYDDSKSITEASGVGNKLAKRIILELKDKLKNYANLKEEPNFNHSGCNDNISQAANALSSLGYSIDTVMPKLLKLDSLLPVEDLIREVLKAMN